MSNQNCLILLNYKSEDDLKQWVSHVKNVSIDIILIDNDPISIIDSDTLRIVSHTIRTGKNLGYAGGLNVGLEFAMKGGYERVAVVNPDIEVNFVAIQLLFDLLQDNEIVHPKIVDKISGHPQKIPRVRSLINETLSRLPLVKKWIGLNDGLPSFPGSFWCINTKTLTRVGLLDDRGFLYGEERDYSFRCHWVGCRIREIDNVVAYHRTSSSVLRVLNSVQKQELIDNNLIRFYVKFLPLLRQKHLLYFLKMVIRLNAGARRIKNSYTRSY